MYNEIEKWLDNVLEEEIPEEVVSFCFNLYEDGNDIWSMELIGSERFDDKDEDWACDEISDFGTRVNNFVWNKEGKWDEILEEIVNILKQYLKSGKNRDVLKSKVAIGIGFVDGDIDILYKK